MHMYIQVEVRKFSGRSVIIKISESQFFFCTNVYVDNWMGEIEGFAFNISILKCKPGTKKDKTGRGGGGSWVEDLI